MASSDKPDFIETDQKEAPVKLTTGAEPEAESEPQAADRSVKATDILPRQADSQTSANSTYLEKTLNAPENDDVSVLRRRGLLPGRNMRRLPFGAVTFIGLLLAACIFSGAINEFRNRTLTNLATAFAIDKPGFVETVGDLADTYELSKKPNEAIKVLNRALADLSLHDEDKGAKGAFVRLKLAATEFRRDNDEQGVRLAQKALELMRTGGTYVPYETPFLFHDVAWQCDNNWDYTDGVALNLQAIDIWPRERPNYRSDVQADIGFEYNRLKQFEKAESWYKQALNQTLKRGDCDDNVWRLAQLGQAQLGQKKYMEAGVNLNSALEMQRNISTKKHALPLAQIYTDLGRLNAAKGNLSLAQRYLEDAAAIFEKKKNGAYYYLVNALELANVYRDSGHLDKARPLYSELLRRLREGERGPSLKDVNRDFDLLLARTGGK